MKNSKWIGILGIVLLYVSAFQAWVVVPMNISITGMNTTGTNFGKPALMNLIVSGISAVFFLVSSVMAKRANIFFCGFNLAWSIRNYVILSTCRGGDCPEKKFGLYLLVISAIVIMLASLFPDIQIKTETEEG